ncbi:protein NEGATIVE GRAVITROPIC RESPONSE OF ROOTS-like [Syzygium oleosum]|uniref:protein NEGATIVE GRAVITROPIC RESPONSE OF ROOTS-like n=1 Tax=Syzygium oleosum TaxID=219896 RepID=UPI0011D21EB5|nr:protein NEGATIVE GRAVITROPIC RESPONSE OF ROOTS-like [Syzygium oleosum]
MKLFSWVQNKLSGPKGNAKPEPVPASKYHPVKQEPREEFSDWPQGLLAIGTFGNSDLGENQGSQNNLQGHNEESQNNLQGHNEDSQNNDQENPASSPDISDFTPEEVGKLQKALTKLLSRKPSSKVERETTDLPLDRFLNCPSSLEVDRRISSSLCSKPGDRDEDIERTISIIIGKCKEICADNGKKAIGKKSISFLLKKMFVCRSGFAPATSLRDPLPESRMEKLLRTLIRKKMYPQNTSRASSMKRYLEDKPILRAEKEKQEEADEGSKWDKTDSEYIVLEI